MTSPESREAAKCIPKLVSHVPAAALARKVGKKRFWWRAPAQVDEIRHSVHRIFWCKVVQILAVLV